MDLIHEGLAALDTTEQTLYPGT